MRWMLNFYVFVVVSFVFATRAEAYIDPGTGSMMIQALLAAVAACAVGIGIFWRKCKLFFGRLFSRNKDE